MINFYGYKRCSTSRSAQKWLQDHNVDFTFQDRGLKYFFNTHGQDYRKLNLKERVPEMSIEEAADMMSKNGKLIKRPLVVDGQKLTCGFKEDLYEKTWL